jgi:hypothetical protein
VSPDLPLVLLFPTRAVNEEDRGQLKRGEYTVRGRTVGLEPPLDWGMDPAGNLAWRFWLHTMQFLDGPLRIYEEDGDLEALAKARDLLVDWVDGNRGGSERSGDYAWTDMSAGVRASFLGYGWRECRRHGLLDEATERKLTTSVHEHAEWLLSEENYTPETNHGLYEDAGLFLMARYTDELEEAAGWRDFAERRFVATLAVHVDFESGVHKEHSPGYQMYIRELVKRLHEEAGIGGADLAALLPKLDDAAGWMVLPDGRQLPFGDTDLVEAPAFARERADHEGMRAFLRAGYAMVRRRSSYLAVTGSYHTHAHKHADELSWCLFENDHLIVADPARYSYRDESDPARIYARSSWGHNVLMADGESFPWFDHAPYGSALRARAEGGGWFAVLGANPLLDGVEHERIFLYRAGEIAIVVDRVRAADEREIVRRVQLGPQLKAVEGDRGVAIHAIDRRVATLFEGSAGRETRIEIAAGIGPPAMNGWVFPHDEATVPAPAVTMRTKIDSGLLVHGLAVEPIETGVIVEEADAFSFLVRPEAEDALPAVRVRSALLGGGESRLGLEAMGG